MSSSDRHDLQDDPSPNINSTFLQMGEISSPSAPGADVLLIYPKDVGGNTKLAIRNSTEAEIVLGSGGGTPGGAPTQVQFNDAGVFGGDSKFIWDKTAGTLKISNPTSSPVALFERESAVTNSVLGTLIAKHKSTVNIADDFGVEIALHIEDDTSGDVRMGSIVAQRAGADNTSKLIIQPVLTGSDVDAMVLDSAGRIGLGGTPAAINGGLIQTFNDLNASIKFNSATGVFKGVFGIETDSGNILLTGAGTGDIVLRGNTGIAHFGNAGGTVKQFTFDGTNGKISLGTTNQNMTLEPNGNGIVYVGSGTAGVGEANADFTLQTATGIGAKFIVNSSGVGGVGAVTVVNLSTSTGNVAVGLLSRHTDTISDTKESGSLMIHKEGTWTNGSAATFDSFFSVRLRENDASIAEKFRISSDGMVGINTSVTSGAGIVRIESASDLAVRFLDTSVFKGILGVNQSGSLLSDASEDDFVLRSAADIRITRDGTDTDFLIDDDGVEVKSDKAYYLGDSDTDGTWRMIRSGDDLLMQQRESSVYVTKQTISGA